MKPCWQKLHVVSGMACGLCNILLSFITCCKKTCKALKLDPSYIIVWIKVVSVMALFIWTISKNQIAYFSIKTYSPKVFVLG